MDKYEIADEAVRQQKLFNEYLEYSGVTEHISWVCQDFTMAELLYGEEGVRNEFTLAVKMYFDNINYFAQLITTIMQEILEQAAIMQQNFKQEMNYLGYEPKTTFYGDFTIAELVSGVEGVKDTFKRSFEEWKNNIEYFTELVLVLNHKSWEHYEKKNNELYMLYVELYDMADEYLFCSYDFSSEDLSYAMSVLD